MKLAVSAGLVDGDEPFLAAVVGDLAVRLRSGGDPLLDLLTAGADWAALRAEAEQRLEDGGQVHPVSRLRLLAPVRRPGKVIAIGLNYQDHALETGLVAPSEPMTFAKYSTSVVGPGEPIVVPTTITTSVDWEAELAVVIGTTCGPGRRGTMADIGGYTVGNDVSARDLQFRDGQWTRGKSLDTFCPLGPYVITSDDIGNVHDLRIWTDVSGVRMQDASTADLIFDIPYLLDFLTATVTLEPGDVILTGTPPGVGGFRTPPVYLADGDVVTVGVEGIGELSNPVTWRTS
ncbi:ureidoglycolate lyase [Acidothermaceae bacterium B102]|nr:ureidoglycolate lyase [Acidothermaceae bacterium B102]